MKRFVMPLEAAAEARASEVGGKGRSLGQLGAVPGVRVPPGFAVTAAALSHFVEQSLSARQQARLAAQYLEGDRGPLFAALAHARFPEALRRELLEALPRGGLSIVRSSGAAEDSASRSLAGHFASVVSPTRERDFLLAVKTCWLVGLRVHLELLREVGSPLVALRRAARSLGLVVQRAVNARASGVYFSQSPQHVGRALVSAGYGTCHGIVDGSLASDLLVLDGARVASEELAYKFEMTVLTPSPERLLPGQVIATPLGPAAFHLPYSEYVGTARVPEALSGRPVLSERMLAGLLDLGARAKRALGCEVDVEWSFERERLFALQARPITTLPSPLELDPESTYTVASAGVAEGPARIVRSVEDIAKVRRGDVMIVGSTDPDFMPAFYRAAGIIAEDGSPLSHTAIVARELGIPCLTGVEGATRGAFREGELVCVDARRGRIAKAATTPPAEKELARNGVVYRLEHLSALGRAAGRRLAASAILQGFFEEGGGDPTEAALGAYLSRLRREHRLGRLAVHWDLRGGGERAGREPGVLELRRLLRRRS